MHFVSECAPNAPGVRLVSESDFGFELVVEHAILSDSDAAKVLKSLSISANKLPKIWKNDPQIAGKNAAPGQVVAIHRKDSGSKYLHYRMVVDSV